GQVLPVLISQNASPHRSIKTEYVTNEVQLQSNNLTWTLSKEIQRLSPGLCVYFGRRERLEGERKKGILYASAMADFFSLRLSSPSWVPGLGYDSSHSLSQSHPVWNCRFELKQCAGVHLCQQ